MAYKKKKEIIYENPEVCVYCGSDNVQTKMWVRIKDKEVMDTCSDGESEDNWCPDCKTHCRILSEEEYSEMQLTEKGIKEFKLNNLPEQ